MVDTRAGSRNRDAASPQAESVELLRPVEEIPSASTATAQDDRNRLAEEERALEEKLADLRRIERIAHLRRKVAEWENRQAAGFPDSPLEPPSDALTRSSDRTTSAESASLRRSRPNEDEDDDDDTHSAGAPQKRRHMDLNIRIPDPPHYRARSFREYVAFIRSCEQRFEARAQEFRSDRARALYVKAWSDGEVQDAIYRRLESAEGTPTWDELKQFLQSLLAPESQRTQDASRAYHAARQRKDQTVNSFITYIEGLEESLPAISEANRIAHLKQALRSDIAVEILASPEQPTTRNALVDAAQRAEQVNRLRDRAHKEERLPYRSGPSDSSARPQRPASLASRPQGRETIHRSWTAGSTQTRPPPPANQTPLNPRPRAPYNPTAGPPRDKSKDTCRHCGKLGHWEKDCWKKNGGKPGQAKA